MNEFFGAAKERGVQQFLAIVCSPPARMARNGLTFVSPGPHTPNLKPGYEGQFARYMAEILDHFRSNPDSRERIDFNYISRVNTAMGMEGLETARATKMSRRSCAASASNCGHEISHRR